MTLPTSQKSHREDAGGIAMRNDFLDQIGDMLFAVAMAAAIGFGAANLAIQVNKERAALDTSVASQKLGQLAYPTLPGTADTRADEPGGALNF
jgi:hypothetical protein